VSGAADLVASLGGIGRLRPAPGTWGSLAALAPGAGLLALGGPFLVLAAAIGLGWLGWRAISALPEETQRNDAGWVVIDEAAGQWVALAGLGAVSWPGLVAAFLLFRLFDIAKPWPVSWADRRHDAAGIMLDDLLAGAMAALVLLVLRALLPEMLP
jgi:phosphatidylglycerophosphatase A